MAATVSPLDAASLSVTRRDSPPEPAAIERALTDLWHAYVAEQATSGTAPARARLANLVAYTENAADANEAARAVTELNAYRPVRAFLVQVDESAKEMAATAGLQCGLLGPRNVCFEEVRVACPPSGLRALPSLLEPLTLPDLPVYLWFFGRPPEPQSVTRLAALADRVLTDSHSFAGPLAEFRELDRQMTRLRGAVVFTDFTWARLGTWREAVGKLFDPVEHRQHLATVREVRVRAAPAAGEPSDRALLMVGWLAARLGWRPGTITAAAPWEARFEASSGPVVVRFETGPAPARGHLLSVELHTDGPLFRVERVAEDPGGAIRSVIIEAGVQETGPSYRGARLSTAELLVNAMDIRTPFRDFEDALASIAGLEDG